MTTNESREPGFIGRQPELAVLTAALDHARAGRGQIVMLAGEPGIGKTRTARELAAYAEQNGVKTLWGSCYEGDGAPPYWPWTQALAPYVEHLSAADLSRLLEYGNAGIAEMIPQIGQKLPYLVKPPALEPEQAQFRLFDSVAMFLKNASASGPLLIVLEDLHWADHASLMLLEFVISATSGAPLMLLGTYRDVELGRRHPLSRTLGELVRDSSFQRLYLSSFNPTEVGRFVESRASISLDASELEFVHRRTGGNPLFLNELIRLQTEEGDSEALKTGLPEGIRDVIGRRLDRLSPDCNDILAVASILGRDFTLAHLGPLTEVVTDDRLSDLLEEASSAWVIEALPQPVGGYRFTHALVQETLAGELSTTRKVRLHARIAKSLEELYGENVEAHAAELAFHFAEAQTVLGTEKHIHYSLLAGGQALKAYANEDALSHFQNGLAGKEGHPMDAESAALFFGLGRAQLCMLQSYEIQDAMDGLRRAFEYYAANGDIADAVAVAEYQFASSAGQRTGLAELISRALTLVPPDSPEAGRLLSRFGLIIATEEGEFEKASLAFDRALVIAEREADKTLEIWTLVNSSRAYLNQLQFQEAIERGKRAIQLTQSTEEPRAEAYANFFVVLAYYSLGDPESARLHANQMVASTEKLHERFFLCVALWAQETIARLTGDMQLARDFNERGLRVSPLEPRLLFTRALLEYELGEFAQGRSYIERLLESMRLTSPGPTYQYALPSIAIPLTSRMSGSGEFIAIAKAAAETVLSSNSATPMTAMFSECGLAMVALWERNDVAAKELYGALKCHKGTMLIGGGMCIDRLLGLLSETFGRLDQAIAHFEDALDFCRDAGYRSEYAWTVHDHALAVSQRDNGEDQFRAAALVAEALDICQEIGLVPLKRLLEIVQKGTKSPSYPDRLSRREVDVLRLVATGKSNQEIAKTLLIAISTVARHVSNILAKTSAANRTEAAAYAAKHGLVEHR